MRCMMRIFIFILSLFLALDSFAQEVLVRLPVQPDNASAAIQSSPLYGKKILLFGDSYVKNAGCPVQETWHYKLAEKYNMEYHNWGANGNCIAYEWHTEKFGEPMYLRYTTLPDMEADYVVVIGGHNDAVLMHRYEEGTEFFCSKLDILCAGLREKYPSAKICFITPWGVPQPMYKETAQAMQEVCGRYGIPVFDATKHSGIRVRYKGFRRMYFQGEDDTAHLNAAGHDLFLPKVEHFLLGL